MTSHWPGSLTSGDGTSPTLPYGEVAVVSAFAGVTFRPRLPIRVQHSPIVLQPRENDHTVIVIGGWPKEGLDLFQGPWYEEQPCLSP